MPKVYAIGDIHGCNEQLNTLLSTLNIQSDDTLIFLGDTIDRGADSKGVLDNIIYYQSLCHVILIQGNHEEMMLGAVDEKEYLKYCLKRNVYFKVCVLSYHCSLAKICQRTRHVFNKKRGFKRAYPIRKG